MYANAFRKPMTVYVWRFSIILCILSSFVRSFFYFLSGRSPRDNCSSVFFTTACSFLILRTILNNETLWLSMKYCQRGCHASTEFWKRGKLCRSLSYIDQISGERSGLNEWCSIGPMFNTAIYIISIKIFYIGFSFGRDWSF